MSESLRPRVSVVIPVRNGLPWICTTLKSVLEQSLSQDYFEIIVVDDGSTDGTSEYCRTLLAAHPVSSIVVLQSGAGVSAARNRGVVLARADWIKLLDADDLLHPRILEEELAVALTAPQDVAVIASPWCRFREDVAGKKWFDDLRRPSFAKWATLTLLRADGFVPVGSYCLRKSFWRKVDGFSERRAHVEDVDFLLRVADAGGNFVATSSPGARFYYRTRTDSVSMTGQEKIVEGSILNVRGVEARAMQSGRMCDALKDVLLDVYGQGLRYWFVHDRSKFEDLYRHVRLLEPRYIPKGPKMLSLLSRALGYPGAERIARAYRSSKRVVLRMMAQQKAR